MELGSSALQWPLGAMAVLGLLLVWYYWFHLYWKYVEWELGLQNLRAVPNIDMPQVPTPQDWGRCQLEAMEFSLPPELAENLYWAGGIGKLLNSYAGRRRVMIGQPEDTSHGVLGELLRTASAISPKRQQFTLPTLRLACYEVSAKDFSWSMSRQEVRWYAFRAIWGRFMRPRCIEQTESLLRKDAHIVVEFSGNTATLYWQCTDCGLSDCINFVEQGDEIDPSWVRAVAQSIKLHCCESIRSTD